MATLIKKPKLWELWCFIKHILMGKDMYNDKAILLVTVFNISPNSINNIFLTGRKAGRVHLLLIRGVK